MIMTMSNDYASVSVVDRGKLHEMEEDFDEKAVYMEKEQVEEDAAALLLSDQLMEEDDESEIYEMEDCDEEDDEIIAGTPQPSYSDEIDASFCEDEDLISDEGLVQENPFEPVYPAANAGLLFEVEGEEEPAATAAAGKGIVLEAISLDNILPAGSRRRRN